MSNRDRWREIDAVLSGALELPPPERAAYVRARTAGDSELAGAVEDLLRAGDQATSFLERPLDLDTWVEASEEFFTRRRTTAADEASYLGLTIGVWRIRRELGRGGMARVFLAERTSGGFEQRGALKLLRADLDARVAKRFCDERQILSNLSHPGIARLLDGGTTEDGAPYLVMEAVDGKPITEWCDRRRLGVRERLELFRDVLVAVQYAHANLVVHRDLKPSNIFVTDQGQVKLLDFGIAQLLGPDDRDDGRTDAQARDTERLLLTPEYASPEQVTGRPITTASDIYQLGVLLYRLLSGRRPYRVGSGSLDELRRVVLEEDVPPPSQMAAGVDEAEAVAWRTGSSRVSHRLKGDLDAIVMKAIRKEPADRYASIAELDADLADHLASRPVAATGGGRAYRVRKYFGRHHWALPAVAATCIAVVAYVGVQNGHERQLEAERNVAFTEAARAEAVRDFLVEVFRTADPWSSPDPERGRNITVREALRSGAARARSELSDHGELKVELLAAIAHVYSNLSLPNEGIPLLEEALETQRRTDPPNRPSHAALLIQYGRALRDDDRLDSAEAVLASAVAMARGLEAPHDTAVAVALTALASTAASQGRYARAERWLLEADSAFASLSEADPIQRAMVYLNLGSVYPHLNRLDDARRAVERALELHVGAFGEGDPRTAAIQVQLADVLDLSGRDEESIGVYREAAATLQRALGQEHDATLSALNNLAITLEEVGRTEESEDVLRRVLAIRERQTGVWDRDVAEAMQNLASILHRQSKDDEAEELLTRAHRVFVAVLPAGHHHTAFPLLTRSSMELERADYRAAEATTREALDILYSALPPGHFATAMARCRLGRALLGQRRFAEAEPLLREGAEVVAKALQLPSAYRAECIESLARLLEATGRGAEAQPYLTATASLTEIVAG